MDGGVARAGLQRGSQPSPSHRCKPRPLSCGWWSAVTPSSSSDAEVPPQAPRTPPHARTVPPPVPAHRWQEDPTSAPSERVQLTRRWACPTSWVASGRGPGATTANLPHNGLGAQPSVPGRLQLVWPSAPLSPSPGPQSSMVIPSGSSCRGHSSREPSSHLLDRVGRSGQSPSPVDASSGPSPPPQKAGLQTGRVLLDTSPKPGLVTPPPPPGMLPLQSLCNLCPAPAAPPPPGPQCPSPACRPLPPCSGAHTGPQGQEPSRFAEAAAEAQRAHSARVTDPTRGSAGLRPRLSLTALCGGHHAPQQGLHTPTAPGALLSLPQAGERGADPQEEVGLLPTLEPLQL
ncbi:vegetative cell wall protein gp1-like [Monodon monoceros]|uniref:vegetative cell wall protein gp1-like n=1 Tax=Monodon monoceros TaxID=40151 RepID=UPI0010F6CF5F|nr:vegetative cell wall protein gp1-like [Monodon monoceros]